MDRTIIVQLNPTPEQVQTLHRTMIEHTGCFNEVAQVGFAQQCSNGIELHKQTYYPLRATYPHLPAQLVCAARVKATEAVKSALDRLKKGRKARAPHAQFCPIRYDQRSYWVKWESMTCSVATVAGRVQMSFTVPAYAQKYIGGKVCSADLCFVKGRWTLHIVISLPDPAIPASPEVIGVDLGLNRPAVTSTRAFLGERRWKEQERRIFRIRRKLQAKGTKSAKRHLRKLSGKLLRQRRDHDHVLSKRIVQHSDPGSTIAIENLTHIRSTSKIGGKRGKNLDTKRRLHSWSFAQFHSFLSYKAQEHGIQVVKVDPRHTSQTCSRCGYQARNNRRSQSLFLCRQCGYSLNADLNAALNIREKHLASIGTPVEVGVSQCAHRLDSSEPGTSPSPLGRGC